MTKRKQITDEERFKEKIEDFKQEILTYGLATQPQRKFQPGDKVEVGNLQNCRVHERIDIGDIEGVGYVIIHDDIPNSFEQKRDSVLDVKQLFYWYEIFYPNDSMNLYQDDKYFLDFRATTLMGTIYDYMRNDIDMEPEYQRDYVWSQKDKESLISSIFNNIEIGRFVFKKNPFDPTKTIKRLEIVDGKQRLNAIVEFFTGQFKWNGKYYHELSHRDRYKFMDTKVMICDLDRDMTRKDIMEVFVRINTTGKVMDSAHIEKIQKMIDEGVGQ